MPKRPNCHIPHRDIVVAQQELLKWCPNVKGASQKDLERTCWACGYQGEDKLTRCHIEPYEQDEVERPDNFIILCDLCHSQQPDAMPKEVLKYWLATYESFEHYTLRLSVALDELLEREFGEPLCGAPIVHEFPEILVATRSWLEEYTRSRSFGRQLGNKAANVQWASFAAFYRWCAANKNRLGEVMRMIHEINNETKSNGP